MKKITGILAILALVTTAAQASLNLGLSVLFDNNDLGSDVGIAIPKFGWQFTDNMTLNHTLEGELAFLAMDGDKGGADYDGRAIPLMLNYRMDWTPNDVFGLYAGLGAGFSFNDMDKTSGTTASDDGVDFAYQIQLGTALTFAEQYRFNLGYRYLNTGDILMVDGDHNIIDLGFHYEF